jgi:hypothetical protein
MTKKKDITIVICVLLLVLGLCCIIIGAIGCSAYNVYKLMSSGKQQRHGDGSGQRV